MTNYIEKAKAALESCSGWPINGTTDMALLAIANALVAIAERESKPEHIEDKSIFLADNGAERSNDGVTRWAQLFGTPERAAVYFATRCFGSDGRMCYYCPFDDCDERLRNMGTYPSVHDMMLEWLKGESE